MWFGLCRLPFVFGGLAERFNATVLKTVVPETVPGVRIPHPLHRYPTWFRRFLGLAKSHQLAFSIIVQSVLL